MFADQRQALKFLRNALAILLASQLTIACASTGEQSATPRTKVSMLLPLSGERADLGRTMEQAARLAQPKEGAVLDITYIDTGGTPEGARLASEKSLNAGTSLILGPLHSDELIAAREVTGPSTPILSFSNDNAISADNIYLLGITPAQNAEAILTYARSSGVRRVAVIITANPWDQEVADAALELAPEIGIDAIPVEAQAGDLIKALKTASGGTLPDAVLLPGGSELSAYAEQLRVADLKLLGTIQWSAGRVTGDRNLEGAWIASPDPALFSRFADAYAKAYGEQPGLLAGIAFDAVRMAQSLVLMEQVSEGPAGGKVFSGVTGDLSFSPENRPRRTFSILSIGSQGLTVIHRDAGL